MNNNRPISEVGKPGRPIVAQQAWQERFNGLFQRPHVRTPTSTTQPESPHKGQLPKAEKSSPSNLALEPWQKPFYQYSEASSTRTRPPLLPLDSPQKLQSARYSTIHDGVYMASKPTTNELFMGPFGRKMLIVKLPPRAASASNALALATEPQPPTASFKTSVEIPFGEKMALCTFEMPMAEFTATTDGEIIARTRKRMADFSAEIVSTIMSATADADKERPTKRQRLEPARSPFDDVPMAEASPISTANAESERPTKRPRLEPALAPTKQELPPWNQPLFNPKALGPIKQEPISQSGSLPNTNPLDYVNFHLRHQDQSLAFGIGRTAQLASKLGTTVLDRFEHAKTANQIRFMHRGKHILQHDTAESLGIVDNDTIDVVLVHWGLRMP